LERNEGDFNASKSGLSNGWRQDCISGSFSENRHNKNAKTHAESITVPHKTYLRIIFQTCNPFISDCFKMDFFHDSAIKIPPFGLQETNIS
jgi:hypothetical protein